MNSDQARKALKMVDIPEISGPAAWEGARLVNTPDAWLHRLSVDQVHELEQAAQHFISLGKPLHSMTAADFPLLHFAAQLKALHTKLLHGCGFEVLRGLPTHTYSESLTNIIFCGIGTHLGAARPQNAAGDILGHVRDIGANANNPNTRIYQTNARQNFHTDSADVVSLLCLQPAKEGGQSLLVSAATIANHMRAARPDLLQELFKPIATDRRGEVPKGAAPYTTIPVLSWYEGFLTVYYQRQYIDSAQRFEDAPRLTSKQVEALNMFDALANDPGLHLEMQLEAGDMQFVYNHGQLHDRTAFTDWPDEAKKRHLLRLWLSVPGDRPLPDVFKQRYGSINIGNRGGITLS